MKISLGGRTVTLPAAFSRCQRASAARHRRNRPGETASSSLIRRLPVSTITTTSATFEGKISRTNMIQRQMLGHAPADLSCLVGEYLDDQRLEFGLRGSVLSRNQFQGPDLPPEATLHKAVADQEPVFQRPPAHREPATNPAPTCHDGCARKFFACLTQSYNHARRVHPGAGRRRRIMRQYHLAY